jgi:23S rRNA (cytidine1920-2'-O)/16S rRNA (cytidine1409-2'-O)-methyltransferase
MINNMPRKTEMKIRLDRLMFEKGLTESREKAKAIILGGNVLVNGLTVDKAGEMVKVSASIEVLKKLPYVSRGGIKLEEAIKSFHVSVKDKTAMDVGASTGGFTDFLLQNGAGKVYAVDVGYGQFHWRLRNDPRVVLLEKTNIRYLEKTAVKDSIDIVTIDVSFISLLKVIPNVLEFLSPGKEIIALIKPQFEAGRKDVGKGGVIRDVTIRQGVIGKIRDGVVHMGLDVRGIIKSPIMGPKGNIEYLIYLIKNNSGTK